MNPADPNDVARWREAFASLSGDGSPETIDAGRIFDAVHGRLSPDARHAVIDELLVNPEAAQAWRVAREMAVTNAAQAPPTITPRQRPRPIRSGMAIAAAVVLALGLGWRFLPSPPAGEPVYRSVETRTITSALPPGAALSRSQAVLRWSGIDGARYRVRVLTPDLQVLEESEELLAREYALSEQTLGRIVSGGVVLWQVEGRLPGEAVIVSPTFSIQVR